MAAQKNPKFDASFELAGHILKVQNLGKALLRQAALALGCTDPDDLGTASPHALDPDSLQSCNKIFSSASQQIVALTKIYQMVLKANRELVQEVVLVEVLKEVSPELAAEFLRRYEERLGKGDLEDKEA